MYSNASFTPSESESDVAFAFARMASYPIEVKVKAISLGVNDPYIIYLIPFKRRRVRFSLSLGVNEP